MAAQFHALFGCYLPPANEEVLQAAKREQLEENCGTLAERHLHPLESAIGRLLRRKLQLQGGVGRLKRSLFLRMCLVRASGLRDSLFGTLAPRHIGRIVLALLDGGVVGGIQRRDSCRPGGRSPRDATSGIHCIMY
jgi:hypothetical protein